MPCCFGASRASFGDSWRRQLIPDVLVAVLPDELATQCADAVELARKPLSVKLAHEVIGNFQAKERHRLPLVPVVAVIELIGVVQFVRPALRVLDDVRFTNTPANVAADCVVPVLVFGARVPPVSERVVAEIGCSLWGETEMICGVLR
jgi:hypothetical protein